MLLMKTGMEFKMLLHHNKLIFQFHFSMNFLKKPCIGSNSRKPGCGECDGHHGAWGAHISCRRARV